MMALEPELVHLERLPDDPAATGIVGVYGPNPRSRADADVAAAQIDAAASLLADRVTGLLAGERIDPLQDLRTFVERYWPERLQLAGRAGPAGEAALLVTNPGPVSRYLTSIELDIDEQRLSAETLSLLNPTPGEAGVFVKGDALGPEAGFYVRRQQSAEIRLPIPLTPGSYQISLTLGLAGVATTTLRTVVTFG